MHRVQAVQAAAERSTPAGPIGPAPPPAPNSRDRRAPGQPAVARRPHFVQVSRGKDLSKAPSTAPAGVANSQDPPAKRLKQLSNTGQLATLRSPANDSIKVADVDQSAGLASLLGGYESASEDEAE